MIMKQFKKLIYYSVFITAAAMLTQCKTQGSVAGTEDSVDPSRIIQTEKSEVCDVFTVENPDLEEISQDFADMNLRRQAEDYGPGQYSAFDYWQQVYETAPGFSVLVYTDGSAIYREMARVAKEEGDTALFESNAQKALELLDKGAVCYPDKAAKFGPAKAYVYELLYPNQYDKILDLYTTGLSADTDPYSLGSIYRYAKYMKYINQLDATKADELMEQVKTYAKAKSGDGDYDYVLKQMIGIDDQYAEMEAQAEEQAAQEAEENAGSASGAYDTMMSAAKSGDLTTAMNSFKTYIAGIEDAQSKYQTAMYIGGVMYSASDYPKAREAYRVAMNADSSKGDPYYYVGLMYLSSGKLCGPGRGFDSQRVLWPAFDKLKVAVSKNLSADLKAEATKTMNQYRQYLPTKAQLQDEGLTEGSAYTVPCWINETTTVVSNGK